MVLSCRVNVYPMGRSPGWPLALTTGWGAAAAPNGAAVTFMALAPVTAVGPIAVASSAAYSAGATAGCSVEINRSTASEPGLNTDCAVCVSWLADSGTGGVGLPRPPLIRSSTAAVALGGGGLAGGAVVGDCDGGTAGACSVTLVALAVWSTVAEATRTGYGLLAPAPEVPGSSSRIMSLGDRPAAVLSTTSDVVLAGSGCVDFGASRFQLGRAMTVPADSKVCGCWPGPATDWNSSPGLNRTAPSAASGVSE